MLRVVLEMLLSPSSRGAALDFMQATAPLLGLPADGVDARDGLKAELSADAVLAAMQEDPIAGRRAAMPAPKETLLPSLTGAAFAQLLRPDSLVEALRPGARNVDGSTLADEIYDFMAHALMLHANA